MHFPLAFLTTLTSGALSLAAPVVEKRSWAPSAGSTIFNIGQNYVSEWNSFASAVKTPSGISVYGDIYSGALNSDSQILLSQYAANNGQVPFKSMLWVRTNTNIVALLRLDCHGKMI